MGRHKSTTRRLKRGTLRTIWNNTFNRLEYYRRTSNGTFAMTSPNTMSDYPNSPTLSLKQILHRNK